MFRFYLKFLVLDIKSKYPSLRRHIHAVIFLRFSLQRLLIGLEQKGQQTHWLVQNEISPYLSPFIHDMSLLNSSSTRVYYESFYKKISAQHVIVVINSVLIKTTDDYVLLLEFHSKELYSGAKRCLRTPDRPRSVKNETVSEEWEKF